MLPAADFDVLKTLYAGRDIIVLNVHGQHTGATGTATTDVIALADHDFEDGQQVTYIGGTGFTGLTALRTYVVRDAVAGVSFKVAETVGGAAVDITADGSAGIFARAIVFAAEELDQGGNQDVARLKLPGTDGVIRTRRSAFKEDSEEFTYPTPEVRRLLEIFDGALKGRKVGYCILYAPDIDDAAGFCALVSERFTCEVTREGNTKLGGGDFSKASLKILSTASAAVQWDENANIGS